MFSVIIPMGGSGVRTGKKVNKALLPINGKSMFLYSYELFKKYDCEIILVVREEDYKEVKSYVDDNTKIVLGGSSRALSVYNGLKVASCEYVLVHDACRCFLTSDIVDNVLKELDKRKAVLVYTPVKDTIRDFTSDKVLKRSDLIAAQTPQAAKTLDLRTAYEIGFKNNEEFTDDISAIEKYTNIKVSYVLGSDLNYKITTKYDILLAELMAKGGVSNEN